VSLVDRVYEGMRNLMRLNDRLEGLTRDLKELSLQMRDIDRRLIRVETALELASEGRFRPGLLASDDGPSTR
jgi:hypothetical protein